MTNTISPAFSSPVASPAMPTSSSADGFGAMLDSAKGFVSQVNDMQHAAADASTRLALGETDDMVGTLATVEKADLAFKTLLAVRSKLMAAFDEIRNMPV
ncbi:MAG: flagellar hook-basal body complex protein FliE [Planctomycetota bacterium]